VLIIDQKRRWPCPKRWRAWCSVFERERAHALCLEDYSPILCLARVIFFAKLGETMTMANAEPQLPDVSTIS
jgi:hypothetical protein